MKNVVITGADGFVGSNTVKYFLEKDINVLAIDVAETPSRLSACERLKYLKLDISDIKGLEAALSEEAFDTFIHFAWAGSAGAARADYELQIKNALNAVECLKAAKRAGCKRFVCAGSIMEKEVEAVVHARGSRPGIGYIYGMGKHAAHCLCKAVAANEGIELVWAMITNAYGVGEISPRFVNTTIKKIIDDEPLQFTSAVQNYDFVYITDVARAFYLIAQNGKPFCEYIIGSGSARPLRNFIEELAARLAPARELLFGDIPFTGVNLPLSAFDSSNTENDCGFVPKVNFSIGTQLTMEWLKSIKK